MVLEHYYQLDIKLVLHLIPLFLCFINFYKNASI